MVSQTLRFCWELDWAKFAFEFWYRGLLIGPTVSIKPPISLYLVTLPRLREICSRFYLRYFCSASILSFHSTQDLHRPMIYLSYCVGSSPFSRFKWRGSRTACSKFEVPRWRWRTLLPSSNFTSLASFHPTQQHRYYFSVWASLDV